MRIHLRVYKKGIEPSHSGFELVENPSEYMIKVLGKKPRPEPDPKDYGKPEDPAKKSDDFDLDSEKHDLYMSLTNGDCAKNALFQTDYLEEV